MNQYIGNINWAKAIPNFVLGLLGVIVLGMFFDAFYAAIPPVPYFASSIELIKFISPGIEDPVSFIFDFIYATFYAFYLKK